MTGEGINIFSLTLKIEHVILLPKPEKKRGEVVLTDKKPGSPPGDEIIRVKLPQKRNREMFGNAELMMGQIISVSAALMA